MNVMAFVVAVLVFFGGCLLIPRIVVLVIRFFIHATSPAWERVALRTLNEQTQSFVKVWRTEPSRDRVIKAHREMVDVHRHILGDLGIASWKAWAFSRPWRFS